MLLILGISKGDFIWPVRNLQKTAWCLKKWTSRSLFLFTMASKSPFVYNRETFLLNRCSIDFKLQFVVASSQHFQFFEQNKECYFWCQKNREVKVSNRIYRQCVWMILSFDESVYLSDKLNSIFLLVILGLAWLEGGYLIKRKPMMEWN